MKDSHERESASKPLLGSPHPPMGPPSPECLGLVPGAISCQGPFCALGVRGVASGLSGFHVHTRGFLEARGLNSCV